MIIGFDLDGTLIDTEKWIIKSLKQAFKENHKKAPTEKEIFKYWGLTSKEFIKKSSLKKLTKKEVKKIKKDFHKIRDKTINSITAFPNVKKVLKKLNKKYYLAIISNNKHKEIIKRLKAAKIDKKLFKIIIGDDEVRKPKPFPNEIYKAERKLGKKLKFLVGDTIRDIESAKRAKIKSIIIKTGPKSTWKNLKEADFIIKDIKQLPKIIEKNV